MKPQALALITHLNDGGSVTRDSAWQLFCIQNITARLSELSRAGYRFSKSRHKVRINGQEVAITAWKLAQRILPGNYVEVMHDTCTYLSLQGRTGRVEKIDLHTATATVLFTHAGHRKLPFAALKRLTRHAPGTAVSITPLPLVVLDYHPDVDSYALQSPNPGHTIIVSSALVEAVAH